MYICLKYDLHAFARISVKFARNGQKSVQIQFARICLCLLMSHDV